MTSFDAGLGTGYILLSFGFENEELEDEFSTTEELGLLILENEEMFFLSND